VLFEFEAFRSGMSATSFDLEADTFLSLRCWIRGSNPLSFEITCKKAVGSSAAIRPMWKAM